MIIAIMVTFITLVIYIVIKEERQNPFITKDDWCIDFCAGKPYKKELK